MNVKIKQLVCLVLAFVLCAGCALAYEDLPSGSKGEAVRQMQTRLKELGYYEKNIDGDYGNQSRQALKAFQSANGLQPTGEATADVLQALYAPEAKAVPLPPDVEVTAVGYRSTNVRQKVTIKNNLDEAIEYLELRYITLDSEGKFKPDYSKLPEDFSEEQSAFTDEISKKIGAGKTGSMTVHVLSNAHALAVGVSAYRTEAGKTVRLSTEQITYCTSDGSVIYPSEDPQDYTVMSDEDYARAREVMFGYTSFVMPSFAQTQYLCPAGMFVVTVNPDSIAHMAGLAVGDVVTAIDGVSGTHPYCAELAKLKMLDGETVTLTYWRNNQSHDVPISLSMEAPAEEAPEQQPLSIADELLKYADLLEKGFITQEEYDLLKQKLLSE